MFVLLVLAACGGSEVEGLLAEGDRISLALGESLCACPDFVASAGYADEAACEADFSVTPEVRDCELEAMANDEEATVAWFECANPARQDFLSCVEAGCDGWVDCSTTLQEVISACPALPPEVDDPLQACY